MVEENLGHSFTSNHVQSVGSGGSHEAQATELHSCPSLLPPSPDSFALGGGLHHAHHLEVEPQWKRPKHIVPSFLIAIEGFVYYLLILLLQEIQ